MKPLSERNIMSQSTVRPVPLSDRLGLFAGLAFCLGFVVLIDQLAPHLTPVAFAPDSGFLDYVWKLPDPTAVSRATAWGGYLLHQVTIWALIYRAQSQGLRYQGMLHPANLLALGANAFFMLLHLAQTHLTYDGLAQDTPIWSSQGSVVIMLVMILIMENQRRGMFFGRKADLPQEAARVLRKYHGYVFSWALIYTFWYHPMESTVGHLAGTFYTTIIMLQGSLFFTRVHVNRWWTVTLEVLVVAHGTTVALMSAKGAWAQFFFGFAAVFVVTQMHGLGLKAWQKWAFIAAYVAGIAATYTFRGVGLFGEIFRVPIVEYALVYFFAFAIWLGLVVADRLGGAPQAAAAE